MKFSFGVKIHAADASIPGRLAGRIRLTDTGALQEVLKREGVPLPPGLAGLPAAALQSLGVRALNYFRGEFSFVCQLPAGEILAARDQFGIRPLYYSFSDGVLRISDGLEWLVAETPRLTISKSWLAGFVAFGSGTYPNETVYNEIRRLPPAHYLLWSRGKVTIEKYWTLPLDGPPRYGSESEICEAFRAVLDASIRDHLPEGPCGLMLSGGLDSSTLAAEMVRIMGGTRDLRTQTRVYNSLIEDDEGVFAALTAKRLGFTPQFLAFDDMFYDPHWKAHFTSTAEPAYRSVHATIKDPVREALARQAPVWFEGEGPDNALIFEWHAYLRWLARSGQWRALARDTLNYFARKPAMEWVKHVRGVADRLQRRNHGIDLVFLSWARPGFRRELQQALSGEDGQQPLHPWHPYAFSSFQGSDWQNYLEGLEPTVTGTPIDWRHPFLDLRVVKFMLSLPPIPWARQKYLLRRAMAGELPSEVLSRRKTPLRSDPLMASLRRHPLPLLAGGPVEEFFDLSALPHGPPQESMSSDNQYRLLRIHIVDCWMRDRAT